MILISVSSFLLLTADSSTPLHDRDLYFLLVGFVVATNHQPGDYRSPSFTVEYPDGSSLSPLKYRAHRIVAGCVQMRGDSPMPQSRGGPADATTLIVSTVRLRSLARSLATC